MKGEVDGGAPDVDWFNVCGRRVVRLEVCKDTSERDIKTTGFECLHFLLPKKGLVGICHYYSSRTVLACMLSAKLDLLKA